MKEEITKVQHNNNSVLFSEKLFSILSYMTMGIFGFLILFIAYFRNKKLKFFLNYNIFQSIIIGISVALLIILFKLILTILAQINHLDFIAAFLYNTFSFKIIRLYSLNISFTVMELILVLLLLYINVGVILGRIFYIPYLTDVVSKAVKKKE